MWRDTFHRCLQMFYDGASELLANIVTSSKPSDVESLWGVLNSFSASLLQRLTIIFPLKWGALTLIWGHLTLIIRW